LSTKGNRPKESPYKVLYWMGGALLLLFAGVAALVMLMPSGPKEVPPYERTLLWLFDGEKPSAGGVAAIIEEAHQEQKLQAVSFPAPPEALAVFRSKSSARKAQDEVAKLAGRKVHHRFFLPYSVIEVLIKATGGIQVEGRTLDGPTAIRYITEDPVKGPDRAVQVMLAIADAAMNKQFNMSAGEGLKLAGDLDTDMDLMSLPEVFQRWNSYPAPKIVTVPQLTPDAVKDLLHPDPVEAPEQ
jgi:hypothetical protein